MRFVTLLAPLVLVSLTVLGFRQPDSPSLPDLDRRKPMPPAAAGQAERQPAAAALATRVPGAQVTFDPFVLSPRWVRVPEGFLTGVGGEGGAIPAAALARWPKNDPNRVTKAFLEEHAALFGHDARVLDTAVIRRDSVTRQSGLRTVAWEQQLRGIPVFQARLVSHLTSKDQLVSLSSRFVPDPETAATAGGGLVDGAVKEPSISARMAVAKAAKSLDADLADQDVEPVETYAEGLARRQTFKAALLRGPALGHLVWLPLDRQTLRLCWKVELTVRDRPELYRVLVEAATGEVMVRQCLTAYFSPATYRVYTSDSPSPLSPGHATPSAAQPPSVERELLTLAALSEEASPNGWIDDGTNETVGNNVDAHTDRNDDNQPDLPRPEGSPERVFDFPLSLASAPSTYSRASIVQLFYLNNWIHDRLYGLGFTEAAGNFQRDNFGRGGLGNDAVQADGQDGGGMNNANFSTPEDGQPGRMQMYLWDGPNPDRDGDLDADIVLHEYTHGFSNRHVSGGDGLNALQSWGLGEGWSDFYALALQSQAGDDLDGCYPAGAYATYLLAGLTENYYYGIRRYPYTTDLNKNPLTFKDIDPTQFSSHPGIPINPVFGGGPPEEVHNQGEVWCAALWEARATLVRRHGFAVGNGLILQLVADGMSLCPPNPSFLEARDAILEADRVQSGGLNRLDLWTAFAKRGMGFSAVCPESTTTQGVQESYDVPDDLLVTGIAGLVSDGAEGGPFRPNSITYTLANVSTNRVVWSVHQSAGWLTVNPAAGELAAGAAPIPCVVSVTAGANNLPSGLYEDTLQFTNHVTGRVQSRRVLLRVGQPSYFTEQFKPGTPPLEHRSVSFLPDGSASYYRACGEAAAAFPTDPAGGRVLDLPDDGFEAVALSGGQTVGLYGTNYSTVYVGSNGYLTFTGGFSEFSESIQAHFAVPRVSAFFDDLDPSSGGRVSWKQLADRLAVTFENVPEWRATNRNSFQVELFFDGGVRITWLGIDAADGLAGISSGGGVPDGFTESDFTLVPACLPGLLLTAPAAATEGSAPLTATVGIPAPLAADLEVQLSSVSPTVVTVPAAVIIPAGQTSATFEITVVDDELVNGSRNARILGVAPGFAESGVRLVVHDNEAATLSLEVPASLAEGQPAARGWVRVQPPPQEAVVVLLASSDAYQATVQSYVMVPAGEARAEFWLRANDDTQIDGPQSVTFSASVRNWTTAPATVTVLDNEERALQLSLRPRVSENAGLIRGGGTVSLTGWLTHDLTVALSCSDATELTVPVAITIPAGQRSTRFDLTAVNDDEIDGDQVVELTATAADFTSATSSLVVADDETPPVPSSPQPPHLSTNNPPTVNLSWATGEGEGLVNGNFETGDLTGWTTQNAGMGEWIINEGTFDPESPDGPLPPYAGRFSALSHQAGAGRHTLAQEVAIPVGAASAALQWAHRVRNHASLFLDPDQEFRVEVQTPDGEPLAEAFSTNPGDPLLNNWEEHSFDLLQFAGQTVRLAFIEQDSFGFLNVHLDNISVDFGASGRTTYDVYFGTSPQPGPEQFLGNTRSNSWDLPRLQLETTYYWRIVARRGAAETTGPIWQFSIPGVGPLDHFSVQPLASPQYANEPFAVTVKAVDQFDNLVTNFTGATAVGGRLEFPEHTTGEGTFAWEYPMNTLWHDARVQAIYLPEELGPARRLTALALCVQSTPGQIMNRWTIRMKTTPFRAYGAAPVWERTGWTTVYQRNETVETNGWVVFEFTRPFEYDGASSLMVDFSYNNSSFTRDGACLATPTAQPRALVYHTDSGYGDPLNWSGTNPFPESQFLVPNLRLFSVIQVPTTPELTTAFEQGAWTGNVTVATTMDSMRLKFDDGEGHLGWSHPFAVRARDDLSVALTDAPDPVTVGQPVTYSLQVANSGPSDATGVVLSNALPASTTFVSATLSQGTFTTNGQVVRCELGTLSGGTSATVSITALANSVGAITNRATVTRLEADTLPANNTAEVTTTVNSLPRITVSDTSLMEGNEGVSLLAFDINLNIPSSQTVTVEFATADGSATAGSDYGATNGVASFLPGTLSQTVWVPVFGDTVDETDETFSLRLSNPTRATIADSYGLATIYDDDGPGISVGDLRVIEGNGGALNALFQVTLSAPSPQVVSVDYFTVDGSAVAPSDYTAKSGTVSFSPGSTTRAVPVPIRGDVLIEGDEEFSLDLTNPVNGTLVRSHGVCTIANDDGLPGQLAAFAWSGFSSTQYVGQPFLASLTAVDAQNTPVTNFTGTVSLTAQQVWPETTVGEATNAWEYPMGAFFHDSRLQSIYLASELGPARPLTALALYIVRPPGQTLLRWTLRMKHTSLSRYTSTSRFDRTGWTTVYQRGESVSTDGWSYFQFTTPFQFNGTDNLMIDFSYNNSSYTEDGLCRATDMGVTRSLAFRADSTQGDPLNWGTTIIPDLASQVPNLTLLSRPPINLLPTTPVSLLNGLWSGAITVLAEGTNVALHAADTSGHVGNSGLLAVLPVIDTDGDSMPDYWEVAHSLDPRDPADAAQDADHDGMTNRQEFLAGTDPRDPSSSLRILDLQLRGVDLVLRFTTVAGRRYQIERADNLSNVTWSAVQEVDGTGAPVEVADQGAAGPALRFYHVRLLP